MKSSTIINGRVSYIDKKLLNQKVKKGILILYIMHDQKRSQRYKCNVIFSINNFLLMKNCMEEVA